MGQDLQWVRLFTIFNLYQYTEVIKNHLNFWIWFKKIRFRIKLWDNRLNSQTSKQSWSSESSTSFLLSKHTFINNFPRLTSNSHACLNQNCLGESTCFLLHSVLQVCLSSLVNYWFLPLPNLSASNSANNQVIESTLLYFLKSSFARKEMN